MIDKLKTYNELKEKMSKYRIWKETGISQGTMTLWEKGVYKPSRRSMDRLDELYKRTNKP